MTTTVWLLKNNMRKEFFDALSEEMKVNKDIFLLTGDVGYHVLEELFSNFPQRVFNCGASEQAMMDMGVGLALEGKIPFVYTITPFLLYRPFESVRLYLNQEQIPVKMVGSGRDFDYDYIGLTHFADDDRKIMKVLRNIECHWPSKTTSMKKLVKHIIKNKRPTYINLARG